MITVIPLASEGLIMKERPEGQSKSRKGRPARKVYAGLPPATRIELDRSQVSEILGRAISDEAWLQLGFIASRHWRASSDNAEIVSLPDFMERLGRFRKTIREAYSLLARDLVGQAVTFHLTVVGGSVSRNKALNLTPEVLIYLGYNVEVLWKTLTEGDTTFPLTLTPRENWEALIRDLRAWLKSNGFPHGHSSTKAAQPIRALWPLVNGRVPQSAQEHFTSFEMETKALEKAIYPKQRKMTE